MFNWAKTAILMASITSLFIIVGSIIGGKNGMIISLILAVGMNFFSYWFSDKIVLRMYNAKEVNKTTYPEFYNIVNNLSFDANIPTPKIYIIEESSPNAFATGRSPKHASVAATTGILEMLSSREIRAVMSHEIAHIKNWDILLSTISAIIAGAISSLANFSIFFNNRNNDNSQSNNQGYNIAIVLLAPIASALIQMAISRSREFEADRVGSKISKDPIGLAMALNKIHRISNNSNFKVAEKYPATAQMMIINPLSKSNLLNLFSTHPLTEKRVEKLIEIDKKNKQSFNY